MGTHKENRKCRYGKPIVFHKQFPTLLRDKLRYSSRALNFETLRLYTFQN